MKERIKYWIYLSELKSLGGVTINDLVLKFGEPVNFLGKDFNFFKDCNFLSNNHIKQLSQRPVFNKWDKTKKLLNKYDIKFTSILDDDYPVILKNIYCPPPFIFYRGQIRNEDFRYSIGIVGTRKPSNYGVKAAKSISKDLAESGFTIVSGLAHGIDSIAHNSAVETKSRTYAVMGTGCETVHPVKNRSLAEKIMENGALISEFIPGYPVTRGNFPRRNRIISGLSKATVIIEGSRKSGALITGKFALEQNREVYALPGDVFRPQSEGPNYLIQNSGAKLITSATDIMEDFGILESGTQQLQAFPELTGEESTVYKAIEKENREVTVDELYMISKIPISGLLSIITELDMKGVIRRLPGNKISL